MLYWWIWIIINNLCLYFLVSRLPSWPHRRSSSTRSTHSGSHPVIHWYRSAGSLGQQSCFCSASNPYKYPIDSWIWFWSVHMISFNMDFWLHRISLFSHDTQPSHHEGANFRHTNYSYIMDIFCGHAICYSRTNSFYY